MRKPISLSERSDQERLIREFQAPATVAVRPAGASGTVRGTWTEIERIMSFSSWLRMWQCHTYS